MHCYSATVESLFGPSQCFLVNSSNISILVFYFSLFLIILFCLMSLGAQCFFLEPGPRTSILGGSSLQGVSGVEGFFVFTSGSKKKIPFEFE